MSKVWKKFFISAVLFFSLFMFGSLGAYASTNLTQTGATKTSITVSWNSFNTIANQKVTGYKLYVGLESRQGTLYNSYSASTTSAKISGLEAGRSYNISIYVTYTYIGSSYTAIYDSILDAHTIPDKAKGVKLEKWYDMIHSINVTWKEQADVSGYEYIVYKNNGKKFAKGDNPDADGNMLILTNVSNSMTYTVKVRAYVVINNKKYYGEWSDPAYIFMQPQFKAVKLTDGKLAVKWQKVKGATGYRVYISRYPKSGYKKVKTVSSGKNSVSIKKFSGKKIKKNKNYYIYVQTVEKKNGKTYTSGKLFYWSTKMNNIAYF